MLLDVYICKQNFKRIFVCNFSDIFQRIVDVYIIFIKIKIKMNSATNRRTINFFNVIPEWFISVVILCKTFFNDEII